MSRRHLKAIAAPKSWQIKRKERTWVARPNPGAHKFEESMPISLILKLLNCVKTTKEAKYLLNQKRIIVNNKPVKELKFPAGLFDIINLDNRDYYRVLYNKRKKLIFKKITKEESGILLYKIVNKTFLKKKKLQLNFHNGFNMLFDKDEYNTNDVLIIDENKVKDSIKFEKGTLVYIINGSHIGQTATIEKIHGKLPLNKLVEVKIKDKKIDIPKNYVFPVGKTKSIITLNEK